MPLDRPTYDLSKQLDVDLHESSLTEAIFYPNIEMYKNPEI